MTAALDKSTCTDLVNFGKNEDRFGTTTWEN